MSPAELTDEQFREARRQVAASLRALAASARQNAIDAVSRCADSPQNLMNFGVVQDYLQRARHYANAANEIEMMEREGFDWAATV